MPHKELGLSTTCNFATKGREEAEEKRKMKRRGREEEEKQKTKREDKRCEEQKGREAEKSETN